MGYHIIRYYRKKGYNVRHVVVVGYGDTSQNLVEYIHSNPGIGYKFFGYFDNHHIKNPNKKILGTVDELEEYVVRNNIDLIFCFSP